MINNNNTFNDNYENFHNNLDNFKKNIQNNPEEFRKKLENKRMKVNLIRFFCCPCIVLLNISKALWKLTKL